MIEEEQLKARAKGYSLLRDLEANEQGQLGLAAQGYLDAAVADTIGSQVDDPPWNWPWDPDAWKKEDSAIENLVKAAAFIASEIDRLVWEATNG